MAFISEELAQTLATGTARVSVAWLMKTDDGGDPPSWVRLWLGVGDYEIAPDLIDSQGGVYLGLGQLLAVPPLNQLINGLAERVEFVLSGVDALSFGLADQHANEVRGAPVHLALLPLGEDFQPLSPPIWAWEGEADVLRVNKDGRSLTRSVSVSVGSIMTGRRRPRPRHYSGIDQRQRSPDDAFCDRIGIYNAGSTRKWP